MKVIDLSTENRPDMLALIDDNDFAFISAFEWSIDGRGYARLYNQSAIAFGSYESMHRMILGLCADDKNYVDHINGNRLDNRRINIRICTAAENSRNRVIDPRNKSGYKGVCWHKRDRKWEARIGIDGKVMYLGLFDDPEKAHQAYCVAAEKYHGEFKNTGIRA